MVWSEIWWYVTNKIDWQFIGAIYLGMSIVSVMYLNYLHQEAKEKAERDERHNKKLDDTNNNTK